MKNLSLVDLFILIFLVCAALGLLVWSYMSGEPT